MANITMSPEELQAKATYFDTKSEELGALITEVSGKVQELAAQFQGSTADAFEEQMIEIQNGPMKQYQSMMSQIAGQLRTINNNMTEMDSKMAAEIRGAAN